MDSSDELLQRLGDLLVERGFATSHGIDFSRGIGEFQWTDSGILLRNLLRHLFNAPDQPLDSFEAGDLAGLVALILFTGRS